MITEIFGIEIVYLLLLAVLLMVLSIWLFIGNTLRKSRKETADFEHKSRVFSFNDNNGETALIVSDEIDETIWDIGIKCRYTNKAFLKSSDIRLRLLPFIAKDEHQISPISLDKEVYSYKKVFAKPDAVLKDTSNHIIYIIEYKSKLVNYDPEYVNDAISPQAFLQCLIATWVFINTAQETDSVIPVLRFSNAVIVFTQWQSVAERFEFYRNLYFTVTNSDKVKHREENDGLASAELARFIALVDPDFLEPQKDEEEGELKGKAMEHMLLHGGYSEQKVDKAA